MLSRPDGQRDAPLCFSRVEQTFVNVVEELVDVAVADYATRTGGGIRATVGHPFWVSAINGTPAPLADPDSPHMARSMTYCRDADGATLTGSCGWVFAADLRPGYALSSTTGTPDVTAVRQFRCERTVVYNFRVAETHSYFVATPDGCTAWVHNNNAGKTPEAGSGRARNHLKPVQNAGGEHCTFKRDPVTGKITGYAEWKPNARNPSGFDEVKRVDVTGGPHTNKATKEKVPTPHVHGKDIPGGVRPAQPDEVPNG